MLHRKCYDETILNNKIYNPNDPSFSKKSYNYYDLEQHNIENQRVAVNSKGVSVWKSLSKHLVKSKKDVDKEVYLEVPEIAWTKPKNLVNMMPRLDQLVRFFDEG